MQSEEWISRNGWQLKSTPAAKHYSDSERKSLLKGRDYYRSMSKRGAFLKPTFGPQGHVVLPDSSRSSRLLVV